MLVQDEGVMAVLKRVVCSICKDQSLQDDLMQEAMIHLWKTETAKPHRKLSWYLQSCWFHLHHWLAAGRSVDSPKRSTGENRITVDEHQTPDFDTNGELFERVCFDDLLLTLHGCLPSSEVPVLDGLAEGRGLREVCSCARLSYPTALKYRRHIASIVRNLEYAATPPTVATLRRPIEACRGLLAAEPCERLKGCSHSRLPAGLAEEVRKRQLPDHRAHSVSSTRS